MLWEVKDINFFTLKNPKDPSVGHCETYHLMFESHGDYMCDELIKRSLNTFKCFGYCSKPNYGYGSWINPFDWWDWNILLVWYWALDFEHKYVVEGHEGDQIFVGHGNAICHIVEYDVN